MSESEDARYRQKCKDLRKRIREIEESNDAMTLKLARTKRSIQRLRLERAFLLERLEERTPARPSADEVLSPLTTARPIAPARRSPSPTKTANGPSFATPTPNEAKPKKRTTKVSRKSISGMEASPAIVASNTLDAPVAVVRSALSDEDVPVAADTPSVISAMDVKTEL
ncbi:hypothetical protein YB2330_001403 [Saitoella coloradoensis]